MHVPPPSAGEIREKILVRASPEHVRECILSPQGILDYYPMGNAADHVDPGKSFYCKGTLGISLFEIVRADPDYVLLEVHNAMSCAPPYTEARIKEASFFSMLEDWYLEPASKGAMLTRLWRGFRQQRMRGVPVRLMVRAAAKLETRAIRRHWAE
jgi:hypothetical protein